MVPLKHEAPAKGKSRACRPCVGLFLTPGRPSIPAVIPAWSSRVFTVMVWSARGAFYGVFGTPAVSLPTFSRACNLLGIRDHATVFPQSADDKNITEVAMAANAPLPVPTTSIPVAGFKDVYNVAAVEKALQDLPPSANEALRALYEKILRG